MYRDLWSMLLCGLAGCVVQLGLAAYVVLGG